MKLASPPHIWIPNHLNKDPSKHGYDQFIATEKGWGVDRQCISLQSGTLVGSCRRPSHIRSCGRDQHHKAMTEAHWHCNHTPFLPPQGASWRGDDLRTLSWSRSVLSQGQHRLWSNLEELLAFWSDFYLLSNWQSAAMICSWTWEREGLRAPFYHL